MNTKTSPLEKHRTEIITMMKSVREQYEAKPSRSKMEQMRRLQRMLNLVNKVTGQ